jgi:hypothetical protein
LSAWTRPRSAWPSARVTPRTLEAAFPGAPGAGRCAALLRGRPPARLLVLSDLAASSERRAHGLAADRSGAGPRDQ